jgi:nucleotide-binding universal stress UspA family protein
VYRKILTVLDGSQVAEVVFPVAKEFAARLGLDIVLLHVYSPMMKEFIPMYQSYINQAADTIKKMAQEVQSNLGTHKAEKTIEVHGELVMGYHADAILKYADENNIDLILMASHGRSGVKQWNLGSVADKILRASKIPVWVVRAGVPDTISYDNWPRRTFMVPLTGAAISESAIPHAIELARHKGPVSIDVVLLQVCEPPTAPSYYSPEVSGIPMNWVQLSEQELARMKKNAAEYLVTIETKFKNEGIANVKSLVLVGKATDEIISYANKNPFTVIVMATHGRSGFSRFVYGSVAESVLFGVNNPLVLIKPQ